MITIFMMLLVAALFLGILLNLATENRLRNQLTGIAVVVAAVIGVILYGYGFVYTFGPGAIAVFRALLAICRMFAGVNEFGTIQSAPIFGNSLVVTVFWIGHFLAFYVTASTAVAALGGKLLRKIRTILLRRGELLVIYGVSNETIAYARKRMEQKNVTLLFVDDKCDNSFESTIIAMGGIVDRSTSAIEADLSFLRHIGVRSGKRKLNFAAMQEDGIRNLFWARNLLVSLKECEIDPMQTSLIIRGVEEQKAEEFLAVNESGFGNVYAYNDYTLAARLMISEVPPCDTLNFNSIGEATESFSAAIIGFGQMGRAVLSQLIMNGQFDGSTFRLDIFDERAQFGSLMNGELMEEYQIRYHACTGRSTEFYHFLNEHGEKLKYIVISTGNQQENQEISQELENWYSRLDHKPTLIQITRNGLLCQTGEKTDLTYQAIYGTDAMDVEKMDRLAMIINQQYCAGNGKTAEENWKSCDYFSRMSCRASADFARAILKAAGKTEEELISEEWNPDKELLEHLAITEHLRWCAFHKVMGYCAMKDATWQERANAYTAKKAQKGSSSIRIGKDTKHKLHACLIPWEALDELSMRENHVTGGHVDYKEMDRQNILALQLLLRKIEE